MIPLMNICVYVNTVEVKVVTIMRNWINFSRNYTLECILRDINKKAIAPHSSTLAWKIPWMEEPGRLQSMGSRRVRHD